MSVKYTHFDNKNTSRADALRRVRGSRTTSPHWQLAVKFQF